MRLMPARRTIATLSTLLALHAALVGIAHAQEFQYSGDDGPAHWSELNAAWEACAGTESTARQSPIDIGKVAFDRSLRRLDLRTYPTTIDIFNNGHTIEQRYESTGSAIFFEGAEYELQQFHFHTLSEHTVNRKHGVMELHAVFSSGGANLVLAVLFEIGSPTNPFIQQLIDAGLPERSGDTTTVIDEAIDLADALTNTNSYFTYSGSLTTPPCSETVTWVVLTKPASVSHAQFEAFRRILGNNFRPLHAANDRVVRATRPHEGMQGGR
jgi:carbonic anhydrase